MRLLEFQAKALFSEYGIAIPEGILVTSPADVVRGVTPAVLKAQVTVGGRGKAGGIRPVNSAEEALAEATDLLKKMIKGHPICALLMEERVPISREFYLSVLYDRKTNTPMVMASAAGGVEIEEVARTAPEKIFKSKIDLTIGLQKYTCRYLAKRLGIQDIESFTTIVERMYAILTERDATLVEINPLVETPSGLVALDAKVLLDDRSEFRHREEFALLRKAQDELDKAPRSASEYLAKERGITYVPLNGEVGMIADGAGTGMLTLDMIQDFGGQAANFCEMGGLANGPITNEAIEVVLANPKVKVLVITLIGGLTRMDEIADGVSQYVKAHGKTIPMVIRMCGTEEAAGKATLRELGIDTYDDMAEAVQVAVAIARMA